MVGKRAVAADGGASTQRKKPRVSGAAASASAADGGLDRAKLQVKSPAQFFADNKNIAGFDNAGKSLYTTIRELVENALDAAEAVPVPPNINVAIEALSAASFRDLVGLGRATARTDLGLFATPVTAKERRAAAKEAKEAAKEAARVAKASTAAASAAAAAGLPMVVDPAVPAGASLPLVTGNVSQEGNGTAVGAPDEAIAVATSAGVGGVATPIPRGRPGETGVFRITVEDNGTGMPHEEVPSMMGVVLAGTNYRVRQSRGKFGLGSKMALIWSKMSTGLPVSIVTATSPTAPVTHCTLDIDIAANQPVILSHTQAPNVEGWRGTKVSVTIEGAWTTYKHRVVAYLRQLAVITPYAHLVLRYSADGCATALGGVGGATAAQPAGEAGGEMAGAVIAPDGSGAAPTTPGRVDKASFSMTFSRRCEAMPPAAVEVKHHPAAVNQLLLRALLDEVPPTMPVQEFLTTQFSAISPDLAGRLLAELGPRFSPGLTVGEVGLNHVREIHALFQSVTRFADPSGACLSPAGEYNLRLGVMKELRPELVVTHAESAGAFEGHPFIVEVAVALGGSVMKPGLSVYRFANRIPLLFEGGNDVVTRTALKRINWAVYKINPATDRVGVFCSIVSTRIPFKGTGKEYIADDAEALQRSVRKAIMACGVQLRAKLARKAAARERAARRRNLARYVPDVARALVAMLSFEAAPLHPVAAQHAADVASGSLTAEVLERKLREHVEAGERAAGADGGGMGAVLGGGGSSGVPGISGAAAGRQLLFFAPRPDDAEYGVRFGPVRGPPTTPTRGKTASAAVAAAAMPAATVPGAAEGGAPLLPDVAAPEPPEADVCPVRLILLSRCQRPSAAD